MLLQIIKKTPILLCAGAMLVFTSCNEEEADSRDAGDTATESVNDTPRNPPNINGSGGQAVEGNTTSEKENSPIEINTGGEGAVKLNPPHGEPGHDCAVQVGQPLSSSVSGSNSPMINKSNNNNTENLNPPHGQPGHDCAVAVGQPLN